MHSKVVELKGIGKKYLMIHKRLTLLGNILGKKKDEGFWALKDINLIIRKGERVGILGPNAAGKTTLFKLIAGISTPTTGKIRIVGKVVSIMNLEAGFHPELTGEENIFINGMLIGMTKEEINGKLRKIIEFADIGKFIAAPFYTYSDGMKFRLALSIALVSNCDILIIDEVFISGDIDFQQKTIKAIRDIQKGEGITTIITSHIPLFVWAFSDTFYFLNKGRIKKIPTHEMKKMVLEVDDRFRKSMFINKND